MSMGRNGNEEGGGEGNEVEGGRGKATEGGVQNEERCQHPWADINVETFESNPYEYLQELFGKKETIMPSLPIGEWEKQVLGALQKKYLDRRLYNVQDFMAKVPSLNHHSTETVRDGQIVHFRCMIQDNLGPEYSVSQHSVTNPVTGEVVSKCTLLRDCGELDEDEVMPTLSEKEVFVAISPPGENFWVTEEKLKDSESEVPFAGKKARMDDTKVETSLISFPNYKSIVPSLLMNVGEGKPVACVLKVYKFDDTNWKHNDLMEVTGIIQMPTGDSAKNDADEINYPELKKVPTLHVFFAVNAIDGNPELLSVGEKINMTFPIHEVHYRESMTDMRELLSLGLGGDRFAAAYALVALVTRVQFLENEPPIGKVILNISGISESSDIPDVLTSIIKALVPRSVVLKFDIENVNAMNLIPKKNLTTNELETGLLQLPIGTLMIINETGLKEGNFNDTGRKNVVALKELLLEQKVKYDYTYQFPEIAANFPTIILSKSPSVLPHDFRIEINPDGNLKLADRQSRIDSYLKNPCKVKMLRRYLSLQRTFDLPKGMFHDETDETLMDDIVKYLSLRNTSELYNAKMSATEFSAFLTCCRLWGCLNGADWICRETFMFWQELERIRDSRFSPR